MSSKSIIQTDQAPAAVGPYSQAVMAGDLVFISGQLGLHPQTGELPGDIVVQTEQALNNLKAVVQAAGLEMTDIVKTTVYVTDMNKFAVVNEVYGRFFATPYPARACIEVSALPKGGTVEIEAMAVAVN